MDIARELETKIIDTITSRFQTNPRISYFIGNSTHNRLDKIRMIVYYAYHLAKRLNGIFFSSNQKTFILYYVKKDYKLSFKDYLNYLKIVFVAVGLHRTIPLLLTQRRLNSCRANLDNYIYIWFLAQDQEYNLLDGLFEVKQHVTQLAQAYQLPVLIETTNKRNLPMYARAGFEVYNHVKDPKSGLEIWYLKFEPNEHISDRSYRLTRLQPSKIFSG